MFDLDSTLTFHEEGEAWLLARVHTQDVRLLISAFPFFSIGWEVRRGPHPHTGLDHSDLGLTFSRFQEWPPLVRLSSRRPQNFRYALFAHAWL